VENILLADTTATFTTRARGGGAGLEVQSIFEKFLENRFVHIKRHRVLVGDYTGAASVSLHGGCNLKCARHKHGEQNEDPIRQTDLSVSVLSHMVPPVMVISIFEGISLAHSFIPLFQVAFETCN